MSYLENGICIASGMRAYLQWGHDEGIGYRRRAAAALWLGAAAQAAILFNFDECPVNGSLPYTTVAHEGVVATLTPVPNLPTDYGYAFWP